MATMTKARRKKGAVPPAPVREPRTVYPAGTPAELKRLLEAARLGGHRIRLEGESWEQVGYVSREVDSLRAVIVQRKSDRVAQYLRTAGLVRIWHASRERTGLVWGTHPERTR